jgi:hypothetical protein
MRKVLATAVLFIIGAPSASIGNPSPLGACTLFDDGLAVGVRLESAAQANPHVISMDIPDAGSGGNREIVVDVQFLVKSDGTVTTPRVLCSKPAASPLGPQLLVAAPKWRFTPMRRNGNAVDSLAAYRIIVEADRATPLPLGFTPQN